jgi:GWxTD domain-containing protein
MRTIVSVSPLVVCLLCIATGSHAEGILVGQGHFEFYLDTASLPTGGEETLELLQIAIPSKEVEYREKDGLYRAAVRVKITVRDGEDVVHQKGYVIRDEREALPVSQDLSGFFFLIDSCYVRPGEYVLDVEIEDTQRRKKTLFGLLGKKYISSALKGVIINIREFPPAEAALGDPVLVWSKKLYGGNVEFIPNPMQIYGLKNDTLSFFTRARVPHVSGTDSLDVFLSVVDGAGGVVGDEQFRAAVAGGEASIFGSFDVNTYPSGTYRLLIEAFDRGGARIAAGKDFSVAWELMNWQKPRREILVEARILLSDTEYEMFSKMSIGEQESMLNDFWKNIDPTPHTAVNETYETFIERMRYADRQFRGDVRGSLTDRGRIYIRFGTPDEIVSQNLPKTRNEMTEVLEKLEDQYKVIAFSSQQRGPGAGEYPRIQSRNPSDTRLSDGKPFRGVGMDSGAFELWIYNLRGEPILERDRIMTVHTGFRFLFVDKDGIGDYRLIGTSEELQETE